MRPPPSQMADGGTQADRLSCRLLRGMDALAGLREPWISLEGASGGPDFFQSFAWSMQVAEAKTRASPGRYEALAAVAENDAGIRAIWPLSRQRREGGWQLRNIDDPFGQFSGVLARDAMAAGTLVKAAVAMARTENLAAVALFERVPAGGVLAEALAACGAKAGARIEAPYVEFGAHASFEGLKASLNKKSMKNQRNALHRIERMGAISHLHPREPDAAQGIVRLAVENRTRWLDFTGTTSPAFRDPAFADVASAAGQWGLADQLAAFELQAGGTSLAQQFGYLHGGRYYAYLSGMDWTYQALAPGRVHLALVLETVLARGAIVAELLTPASDYKLMWTSRVRPLVDMTLPLSAAGRLQQIVWSNGLRPLAKSTYYAMPVRLRRSLSAMLGGRR